MDEERLPLSKRAKLGLAGIVTGTSLLALIIIFAIFPPRDFPTNSFIHVDRGKTVAMIGQELKAKGIIRSVTAFKFFTIIMGGDKRLQVGTYFFKQPNSVINVALKLTNRFLGVKPYRVTIPEGSTNTKIANLLAKQIPRFDRQDFLSKTKDMQGKLFPDTYFFAPLDNVDDIIFELSKTWEEQTQNLRSEALFSGKNIDEIIIMASIIEGEAKYDEDRHLISGILWKRLALGMRLQVDVAKETYKEEGLPDKPINNPGILSIEAAAQPVKSDYLYYLTGRDGKMYYAKDFAGHKKNRRLYLD